MMQMRLSDVKIGSLLLKITLLKTEEFFADTDEVTSSETNVFKYCCDFVSLVKLIIIWLM